MKDFLSKYVTRDSVLLWLALIAASFTYLASMPPPTAWSYQQWMQTGSTAALALIGKLMSSPLSHSKDVQ